MYMNNIHAQKVFPNTEAEVLLPCVHALCMSFTVTLKYKNYGIIVVQQWQRMVLRKPCKQEILILILE
jgi:hypothetical protein